MTKEIDTDLQDNLQETPDLHILLQGHQDQEIHQTHPTNLCQEITHQIDKIMGDRKPDITTKIEIQERDNIHQKEGTLDSDKDQGHGQVTEKAK